MDIQIVTDTVSLEELRRIAKEFYSHMVKGVVDVEREIIAVGGEYHIDANNLLIENGSKQENLWGFNIRFDRPRDSWIEYTSLINIRPKAGNNGMEVKDEILRGTMKRIIDSRTA
jgi:hypothetical protein